MRLQITGKMLVRDTTVNVLLHLVCNWGERLLFYPAEM